MRFLNRDQIKESLPSATARDERIPIRGPLKLIKVAVWISGVLGALGLVSEILRWIVGASATTQPLLVSVWSVLRAVLNITLLILFMKRKRAFRPLAIVYLAAAFLYSIYFAFSIHSPVLSFYADFVYAFLYIISAVYLARSQLAKDTFVR
ncbi:hypothetical protein [Alicyclobacillus fodiniaquatilis]|uniref:Uncharacterized protein n=1 Tax=Alicyclobacillus fodiniaquatilis TaxID=1661150 RepID=A0ABW4JRH8_9BACL